MNKKGLFVLVGGSFRLGNQGNTIIGDDESFEEQRLACLSHTAFLDSISEEVDVNLLIVSYSTKFNDMLYEWYGKYNPKFVLLNDMIGGKNLFYRALEETKYLVDKDFVFFQRIDIILKKPFKDKIFFPLDKIMFSSVCWMTSFMDPRHTPHHKTFATNRHRVNDMLLYVPKEFFVDLYDRKIILLHETCNLMSEETYKHVSFYLDTYHDSDSNKDRNPLYKTANRGEASIWYSEGYSLGIDPIRNHEKTYANIFSDDNYLLN